MDGEVVVKTRLDLEQFEEELKKLDKEKIGDKKIEIDLNVENYKKELYNISKETRRVKSQMEAIQDKDVSFETNKEWLDLNEELEPLEQYRLMMADTLSLEQTKQSIINNYIKDNNIKLEEKKQEQKEVTKETEKEVETQKEITKETEKQVQNQTKNNIIAKEQSNNINKIGSSLASVGKAIVKIGAIVGGLALAGIVASINMIAERNEQVKQKLEDIKQMALNLVLALEPIITKIVDFIYKIFIYLGAILKQWFGVDLFKPTSDSLKSGVKSAKALRKQLMGFDEMNILNKDTGTTGVGGGTTTTKLNFEVTDEMLAKAYKKVKDYFLGLPIPINLDYVGDATKHPKEYAEAIGTQIASGIFEGGSLEGGFYDLLLGEGNAVSKGIDIVEWLAFPIQKGFHAITGLGRKFGVFIANLFMGDEKSNKKQANKNINAIIDSLKSAKTSTNPHIKAIYDLWKESSKDFKLTVEDGVMYLTTSTGEMFEITEEQYTLLMDTLGYDTQQSTADLEKMYKNMGNNIQTNFGSNVTNITKVIEENADKWGLKTDNTTTDIGTKFINMKDVVLEALGKLDKGSDEDSSNVKKSWIGTANDIINKMVSDDKKKGVVGATLSATDSIYTAFDNTGKETKKTLGTSMQEAINNLTTKWKNYKPEKKTAEIEGKLKIGAGAGAVNFIQLLKDSGITFGAKGMVVQYAKGGIVGYPKLAVGGIINRPGRGVPIAVGGERGREGVIPLTDSQQMALLGQEIAKNVIINLTNVTELDGRQIARSVTKVMNDMNFASNGGVK